MNVPAVLNFEELVTKANKLEERVEKLEKEVSELKARLGLVSPASNPFTSHWQRIK